jgi:hypothetical protein
MQSKRKPDDVSPHLALSGLRVTAAAVLAASLAACGGGDNPASDSTGASESAAVRSTVSADLALVPMAPVEVELGQTHLVPPLGKKWNLSTGAYKLKLVGNRAALFVANLGANAPADAWVEARVGSVLQGKLTLLPPAKLRRVIN